MKDRLLGVVPWALVLIGFLIAYTFIADVSTTSRENNVYTRYTACILSIKPAMRDDHQINACWEKVTQDANYYPRKYATEGY